MTCSVGGGVTELILYSTALSGDVGPLAALTQLDYLGLSSTNVTGCPLRLANGKSCDCEIDCRLPGEICKCE